MQVFVGGVLTYAFVSASSSSFRSAFGVQAGAHKILGFSLNVFWTFDHCLRRDQRNRLRACLQWFTHRCHDLKYAAILKRFYAKFPDTRRSSKSRVSLGGSALFTSATEPKLFRITLPNLVLLCRTGEQQTQGPSQKVRCSVDGGPRVLTQSVELWER